LYFIRSLGYDIPAISVSGLEDKSIIKIHKEIGVQSLKPGKPKTEVLQEFGFPVLSKRIAGKIETLQHPTERNNGNFGCINVAQIQTRAKSTVGAVF
jgi:hypothetical protein